MANLSVASIRERIFNTSKHENSVARPANQTSQNPFASMNGNLLNADVYVSSTNNHAEKIGFSGKIEKLKKAAQVGSLSNMGEKIRAIAEPVVAFANRVKEGAKAVGKWLNETTPTDLIKSVMDRTPSQKYYSTAPISETKQTFAALESIESSRMQMTA